jgi:hypothetical protein
LGLHKLLHASQARVVQPQLLHQVLHRCRLFLCASNGACSGSCESIRGPVYARTFSGRVRDSIAAGEDDRPAAAWHRSAPVGPAGPPGLTSGSPAAQSLPARFPCPYPHLLRHECSLQTRCPGGWRQTAWG